MYTFCFSTLSFHSSTLLKGPFCIVSTFTFGIFSGYF